MTVVHMYAHDSNELEKIVKRKFIKILNVCSLKILKNLMLFKIELKCIFFWVANNIFAV